MIKNSETGIIDCC
jgi:hypothetical protein